MVAQVLLQIRKGPLNLVVGVGHSLTRCHLTSETIRKIASDYLLHVELAHLNLIVIEDAEQALLPINDESFYLTATFFNTSHSRFVVCVRLVSLLCVKTRTRGIYSCAY